MPADVQIGDELTVLDWRTNRFFRAFAITSVQIDQEDKVPVVGFVTSAGSFRHALLSEDGVWIEGLPDSPESRPPIYG